MSEEIPVQDSEPAGARDDVKSVERIVTIPAILEAVAELTQMRYVVVARVTPNRWVACAVLDQMDFGLPPGGELEVTTTLCSEVRDQQTPIIIGHASQDDVYCNHPTPKKYGIESYIAVPITLENGEFFGTLCAVDSRPADLSSDAIERSMTLFADLIGKELGDEQAYEALVESEAKRHESDNRIRAVTDAMPGLISYIDKEYRYQFVNHAYTDWFGLKAEEIVRKQMSEVLGTEAFEELRPHIDKALTGQNEVFESEIEYRTGGKRFIRASYTPDFLDGEVRGLFVMVVDITKQKQVEESVKTSEERYRAFIAQSTEGIWRFELDEPFSIDLPVEEQVNLAYKRGYLAESNDAMARQYGFESAAEVAGTRLTELLVEDDPKNREFLRAFIESGYKLSEAESHEKDADGNDRYFLNNFVGIIEDRHLVRAWGTQRDITASRLADDATARLAAIVVSSEDAIISKDLMGIVTSWNVGATKMFGYRAEEIVGKPISVLFPPGRSNEGSEILKRIRREEVIEHYETVRRRKDGTDIMVSLTVSPIRNAEGNVIGASKIVRDITERMAIEEAIHQNQAMLTLAMQSSRMGVWELDLKTNTVSWSDELEEIFGLEKGGFGGTEEHFFALVHEDDRDAAFGEVRAAIAEHRDYNIEFRFYHADGTIRWMEGRGEAVYSQKSEPVRLYGVGLDITERKEAELALVDSERRFARFMQHLPGLAWIKDLNGRYVYANESAEKSFGVSGPKLYGRTDEEIFAPETAAQFRDHDRRALDSGSGIQLAESLLEDDGVLHHSIVSKFPITGADGKAALIGGMAIDVTDQKKAEEALRRSEETFRTLFDSIDEGFCIAEVIFDADGKPIDYRFEQANPAFFALTGFPADAVGRTARELVPDLEQHWVDTLGRVVRSGTPSRFENRAKAISRWFDIFVTRIGEESQNRVAIVFSNITDRKRREANLAFLANWQASFSSLGTAREILKATSTMVGEYLQTAHCMLVEIDEDLETATVLHCHTADGAVPVAGAYRIPSFHTQAEIDLLNAGAALSINDVRDGDRPTAAAEMFRELGIGSLLNLPYRSDGRLCFVLSVSDSRPRQWSPHEIDLLHELAARIYARIERARAEDALRQSEYKYRTLFDSMDEGYCIIEVIFDENGRPCDYRFIEINSAFSRQSGMTDVTGRRMLEFVPEIETHWLENYGRVARTGEPIRFANEYKGLHRWFDVYAFSAAEEGANYVAVLFTDITSRVKAEESLRESSRFNQDVIDSINSHIAVLDGEGQINAVNKAWREFARDNGADWTMQGVGVGTNYLKVCSGAAGDYSDDANVIHDGIERVLAGESNFFAIEYPCHSPTAERWFLLTVTPLSGTAGGAVVAHQNITERRLAEEKIRESEARFRNMADHAPVMVWVTEEDGHCSYLSESWYEFTGQTPETGLGYGWLDAVHPDDMSEAARAFEESTVEHGAFSIEYRLRQADGQYRWAIDSAQPRFSPSGEFLGFIGSVIDIDERKSAEVALRRYQERFDIVKDAAEVGFWFCDLPFDELIWDAKVKEHFWMQADERVTIDKFYERLHPDDREPTRNAIETSIANKTFYEVEYRTLNPQNETHWIRAIGRTFYDENGSPSRFDGVTLDITQLKKDQEALIRAERKAAEEYQRLLGRIVPMAATLGRARDLTTIYGAVREFICVSMPCSGFFVSFYDSETNMRHAAYVWGDGEEVDIAELPPMKLLEVDGGANSRAVFEKRTIITNNYWDDMKKRPHVIVRENGRDPLSSLIVPMMIKDKVLGTLEVQAYEDSAFHEEHAVALEMAANLAAVAIENVRLLEIEASAREAAEAANKAKDEFLSVLSHELRTPLNAMLGWVRMLKGGVLDAENSERALEVIERNTRLQSNLIEDLLDVSRIISGKMRIETELVDLVSVVNTVSEAIGPLADAKDVAYSFVCAEESVFLTADATRLQQVISNLLQNSIKFTPPSGSILIALRREGANAVLRITDTGVGIESALLPHIFDRFRQADASARRNFTGLGLGLTIVRNIVELHGGSIDVDSDGKDRGSTFTLTLPLAADFYESRRTTESEEEVLTGTLAGKSILLVDDDAENLLPLKIFLEGEEADVTPASNASEALRYLAERDFHLMITDIGMPEMDGYELVATLRADTGGRNKAVKAIALTAYASVDDRDRALQSGFQAHLAKPVNFEELISTIKKIASNGH